MNRSLGIFFAAILASFALTAAPAIADPGESYYCDSAVEDCSQASTDPGAIATDPTVDQPATENQPADPVDAPSGDQGDSTDASSGDSGAPVVDPPPTDGGSEDDGSGPQVCEVDPDTGDKTCRSKEPPPLCDAIGDSQTPSASDCIDPPCFTDPAGNEVCWVYAYDSGGGGVPTPKPPVPGITERGGTGGKPKPRSHAGGSKVAVKKTKTKSGKRSKPGARKHKAKGRKHKATVRKHSKAGAHKSKAGSRKH